MRQVDSGQPDTALSLDVQKRLAAVLAMYMVTVSLEQPPAIPVCALRVEEAANALGVSRATMNEMIAAGEIGSIIVHGRSRRVPMASLAAYIRERLAAEGFGNSVHALAALAQSPVVHPTQSAARNRVSAPRKGRKAS